MRYLPTSLYVLPLLLCFFVLWLRRPLRSTLFPYTTLFRSGRSLLSPSQSPVSDTFSPVALRDSVRDRKSTRLNSSHTVISYAVFCLKKKKELATFSARLFTSTGGPVGIHARILYTLADRYS